MIGPAVLADGPGASELVGYGPGDQVGNPLYGIVDEHILALVGLVTLPVLIWFAVRLLKRRMVAGDAWAGELLTGYHDLAVPRRLAVWLVVASSWVHLMLALGHEPSGYTFAYVTGTALLAAAARWLILGLRPRLVVAIIVGSIVAFWFLGAPPDQVGIATKLAETFALALLIVPESGVRRRFAATGVVSLVVLTGMAAWIGAFASAGAEGGHHGGEFPEPATVVPFVERLEATSAEEHVAAALYEATVAAARKYHDPADAEADGYRVGTVRGTEHHAQNPAYIGDGRILDPQYPETLIYAETAAGPLLVGVMFETDGIGLAGPTVAGPLMVWHSHENVCFSLTPPLLAGILSPFGVCPAGSINIPTTGEMLHAWMIPGIEDPWGHLDDATLDDYLERIELAALRG